MHIGLDMGRTDGLGPARVDHDQLGALPKPPLHQGAEDRVPFGRVGTDDHDDVGLQDRIEVLAGRAPAHRRGQAELGGRVADARAVVDVVVAHHRSDEFLREEYLFVGATRGRHAPDRTHSMARLQVAKTPRGLGKSVLPGRLAPVFVDVVADQRHAHPVGMIVVVIGKAALDAAVTVIGLAVLPGRHAHDAALMGFGPKAAADAAIGASGDGRGLRLDWVRHARILPERGIFPPAHRWGRPVRRPRS